MALHIKGKKILITGSVDGIGKAAAIELAKQGASSIIIHAKSPEKVNEVILELKKINPKGDFSAIICDFSKPESIKKHFFHIEELDILINNTGIWSESENDLADINPERIVQLVNVNLASYTMVSKILLPILQDSQFGQILNVVSSAGYKVPVDHMRSIYSATKYGFQGYSESMANEFDNENVRVMSFYPGAMALEVSKKATFSYDENKTWQFDIEESVEAMMFMLTRSPKINIPRMDLINLDNE